MQQDTRAVTSLRYFYEKIQPLHIVAAGSLLEFALAEVGDIPVGRVRNIFVYPFSFAEFVAALGGGVSYERAFDFAKSGNLPDFAHGKMLDYLKSFLIVGGMPAAVLAYAETQSYLAARNEQRELSDEVPAGGYLLATGITGCPRFSKAADAKIALFARDGHLILGRNPGTMVIVR